MSAAAEIVKQLTSTNLITTDIIEPVDSNKVGISTTETLDGTDVKKATEAQALRTGVSLEEGLENTNATGIPSEVFPLLKANEVLELDLRERGLGNSEITELATFLAENTSLKTLILANNLISDEGAIAIAAALEKNISLEVLVLFNNRIGNEGAKAFADMFSKRKKGFSYFVLGENPFDHEHSSMIYQALLQHQASYVENFVKSFSGSLLPQLEHFSKLDGLKGDALLRKFTSDPNQFLEFIHPNPDDTSAHMLGSYSYLSECHCISYFSRNTSLDCRKMIEDMLVSHYGNLNVNEEVFRYVSVSSSDFFPDIVNISRLAQVGKRGRHIEVALIDDYKYSDHTVVVKQIPRADIAFQFMAFLHRMGIQVRRSTASTHRTLLIEQHGFELFDKIFPEKVVDPVATVTLTFFDSIQAYKVALESSTAAPHVILDVDSGVAREKIDLLKTQVKDSTLYLSLAKTHSVETEPSIIQVSESKLKDETAQVANLKAAEISTELKQKSETTDIKLKSEKLKEYCAVRIKAETKKEGQWIPGKVITYSFSVDKESKLKEELRLLAKSKPKPDPLLLDTSKEGLKIQTGLCV